MATIIPFILFILSLAIVLVVIVRKYPQLTLLDIDNVSKIKETKKKNEFVRKRAEEQIHKTKGMLKQKISPITVHAKNKFKGFIGNVKHQVDSKIKEEAKLEEPSQKLTIKSPQLQKEVDDKPQNSVKNKIKERLARPRKSFTRYGETSESSEKQKVRDLFQEGLRLFEEESYAQAEKKFIDVIKVDIKNKDAYRALGDVYYAQGQYSEAEETYKFVVHLDKKDDAAYIRLAQISEEKDDISGAIQYLQQAVILNDNFAAPFLKLSDLFVQIEQYDAAFEAATQAVAIEPDNHRSLDRLLELAIIMSRKDVAEKIYRRLKTADPNSKKLEKYRLKIDQIE